MIGTYLVPSGKPTVCELENGPVIEDLPFETVIFQSYVGLPEGTTYATSMVKNDSAMYCHMIELSQVCPNSK